jgi:hypothetical protein
VVVPVAPFQGDQLDIVETAPGAAVVDQFGFEQVDLGFGPMDVQGITDRAAAGAAPASARRKPCVDRHDGLLKGRAAARGMAEKLLVPRYKAS